jgi:hypothetical protein
MSRRVLAAVSTGAFCAALAIGLAPSASAAPAPINLNSSSCPANIVENDTGGCITELQTLLNAYGARLSVDGDFGPATLAAVKVFQRMSGIGVDGQVGPQSKASLYTHPGDVRGAAMPIMLDESGSFGGVGCLDANSNYSGSPAQPVQGYACLGDVNQRWEIYKVPNQGNTYIVVNHQNGHCLDATYAAGGGNGVAAIDAPCTGENSQKWQTTVGTGAKVMWNIASGRCLDHDATATGLDGQKVQTWDCNGSTWQMEYFF